MTEPEMPPPGDELLIFTKTVRYIAQRMDEAAGNENWPEDLEQLPRVIERVAKELEEKGEVAVSTEEALPLSYCLTLLEGGVNTLAEEAEKLDQADAAHKMRWVAMKTHDMIAQLERSYDKGEDGILTLESD